jgi:adenylate cyclase
MNQKNAPYLIAIIAMFTALLIGKVTPLLPIMELKTIDWRFSLRGVQDVSNSPIVIVTIDDASFEALPERWPWPRHYYAKVIENLHKAGAKVIGIDVILDKPDSLNSASDSIFAATLQKTDKVVLARKLEHHIRLNSYEYLVDPIPLFKKAADGRLGLVSVPADPDGIYRRYSLVQIYNNNLLNSFVLELLRKYHDYLPSLNPIVAEERIMFGEYDIPFYDGATILINYAGPRATFPYYSFSSVIDDEKFQLDVDFDLDYFNETLLPEKVFQDKIVIIGSIASELHDNFPTPFLNASGTAVETPGAEVLANALNTVLTRRFYYKLNPFWNLLILFLLVVLAFFFTMRLSAVKSAMVVATMLLIYLVAGVVLFNKALLVMELVLPVFVVLFVYLGVTVNNYYVEQKERHRITEAFSHYVSPKLVKELERNPGKLRLGGEEREITVLFSDIANFTSLAESIGHIELVKLLNEYLTEMSDIILKYDGTIDKYIGDAIMAEFGAPVYYPDHPIKCCNAALDMQNALKKLSLEWIRQGRPSISNRIGINTGTMVVGNMGSPQKFNYTVIGDEVNLAARLESANKTFGTQTMISESTYKAVRAHFVTRPLDRIIVKGKSRPVAVYELIARKGEPISKLLEKLLPLYEEGVYLYEQREWANAEKAFRQCLRIFPDDGPSRIYLQRVLKFAKNPPPDDWNRVYEMTSK